MSEHYPRIRIEAENGFILVREGIAITFYMRHDHDEVAPKVRLALETYLRVVGPQVLGTYVDDAGEHQPLDEAGWTRVWSELRAPSSASIRLDDASNTDNKYRFEYWGRPREIPSLSTRAPPPAW